MNPPQTSTRSRRRIVRNIALGSGSVAVTAAIYLALDTSRPAVQRVSLATAYAGTVLMAWALAIGPWHVVTRERVPPTSTGFRRDVGIWAAIVAVVHTVAGFQVHLEGDVVRYFLTPSATGGLRPRTDLFGASNATGAMAVVVLALLAAISNDRALRRLGARPWKRLQRATYVAGVAVALHGFAYQWIEKRAWLGIATFLAIVTGIALAQAAGFRRVHALGPGGR